MDQKREIGHTIKAEQDLTEGDIVWLVAIANAILRAFVWDEGEPMQTLANELGVSRTTLFFGLYWQVRTSQNICSISYVLTLANRQ
jgi:hypothetical protein